MGHMGHGSQNVIHCQPWRRFVEVRSDRPDYRLLNFLIYVVVLSATDATTEMATIRCNHYTECCHFRYVIGRPQYNVHQEV